MTALLSYLFESTLIISVLFAVYWFFLRRDTFFQINRFYMLAMVIISLLFPVMPISWSPVDPSAPVAVLLETVIIRPEMVETTIQEHMKWIEIAMVVYFSGVLIFLLRFGFQLLQLYLITRRFGVREHNGQRVVMVDRGYAPFSFFNLVFINESMVPSGTLGAILKHERIHIRQHHSFDLILIELVTILQWFNPVIWLASREMKSIHEYLADEGVLQNGISRPTYQQMILDETMGIQVNALTNNFNFSLLKKRIAMMTKPKSKTWAKGKVLIALPVLLMLLFMITARSFSSSIEKFVPEKLTIAPALSVNDPVIQDKTKQKSEIKFVPVDTSKTAYKSVEKMPSYSGSDDALIKFLVENLKYPETAKKKNIQGKVFVNFIVRADGSVTDVKVMRGIGGGCDEEAVRVVKLMPKWTPGMNKGKAVDVAYVLPIKFALDADKKTETKK